MNKSIFAKGGATTIQYTRMGINSVGIAVLSLTIWTGTVVGLPKVVNFPIVSAVLTGAKKFIEDLRTKIREHKITQDFNLRPKFQFLPNPIRIPISSPGGVPGIRAPPKIY